MSKIFNAKERAENRQKAEVTYKIIASSLAKLETSIKLLRRLYGSENLIISPIMKNLGDDGYHCFINVILNERRTK